MTRNKILSATTLVEEREYHDQLRNTLICVIDILDQLSTQCNRNLTSPLEKFSKFTITVSNNSLITCHADFSRQSLKVINECGNNLVQEHRMLSCPDLLPYKKAVEWSSDKAIQSNLNHQFVQTQSYVDKRGFKLQLLRQIRNLKQDVVTLRELVFHFDSNQPLTDSVMCNRRPEFDYKVIEANKARARNFVRFYKLRKSKRKKKSSESIFGDSSGQLVSIDVI